MRQLAIILLLASTVCGVEIDPPEVPNPWNASEARALVDHLQEAYKQTYDLKTPLAKLQQAYRQAWNARQAELFVQGDTSVDPRWLAARTASDRKVLVDRIKELGGTPATDATLEQLSAQVTQLVDQQRTALKAEAEAKIKAEGEARELAAEQARLAAERKQAAAQAGIVAKHGVVPEGAEEGYIPDDELEGLVRGAVRVDTNRTLQPVMNATLWRGKWVAAGKETGLTPPTMGGYEAELAMRTAFLAAGGRCVYISKRGHEFYWMSSKLNETDTRILLVWLSGDVQTGTFGRYGNTKKSANRPIQYFYYGDDMYPPTPDGVQRLFQDKSVVVHGDVGTIFMQQ